MPGRPRSCGTTLRSASAAASRFDPYRRHVDVNVGMWSAAVVVIIITVDLSKRPARGATHRPGLIPLRRDQSVSRARAFDLAQRPRRCRANVEITVLEGPEQRLDCGFALDLTQCPGRQ